MKLPWRNVSPMDLLLRYVQLTNQLPPGTALFRSLHPPPFVFQFHWAHHQISPTAFRSPRFSVRTSFHAWCRGEDVQEIRPVLRCSMCHWQMAQHIRLRTTLLACERNPVCCRFAFPEGAQRLTMGKCGGRLVAYSRDQEGLGRK